MQIYIAGPMTGYPSFNFPEFDAAERRLREAGHEPINPAACDRRDGFDPDADEVTHEMLRRVMHRDLAFICKSEAIAVLPGWQSSLGCCIEVSLAVRLGLTILDALHLEDITADVREYIEWRLIG